MRFKGTPCSECSALLPICNYLKCQLQVTCYIASCTCLSFKQEFLKEMERTFISSLKESSISLQSALTPCVLQLWSLELFREWVKAGSWGVPSGAAGWSAWASTAGCALQGVCTEPVVPAGSSISWRDNPLRAHLLQAD